RPRKRSRPRHPNCANYSGQSQRGNNRENHSFHTITQPEKQIRTCLALHRAALAIPLTSQTTIFRFVIGLPFVELTRRISCQRVKKSNGRGRPLHINLHRTKPSP